MRHYGREVNQHSYEERPWTDEAVLRELYEDQRLSLSETGDRLGCSLVTVRNWLKEHDIPVRSQSEGQRKCRLSEADLRRLYVDERKTCAQIAETVGCDESTVIRALSRAGIPTRNRGTRGADFEPANPNSYGPTWPARRRERIQLDGAACRRCGIERDDHQEMFGKDLNVHHVEPFDPAEPADPQHRMQNLITFCIPCHRNMEGLPIDTRKNRGEQ